MKQTSLEGMVEVRPSIIMAELEKDSVVEVDPVKTGLTSKAKTVSSKQFKFNTKGKLTRKEYKEIKRTSTNIFDLFSKGTMWWPW